MSSAEDKSINGNLVVSRDVTIGGGITVNEGAVFKHDIKVEGRIDSDNINAFNKGVFLTYGDLCAAYPTPKRGWCAGVGTSTPLALYMADGGEWVATGGHMDVYYSTGEGSGGQIVISGGLTDAQLQAINSIQNKVDKVSGKSLSTNDYTNAEKEKLASALTEHQSLAAYATKIELTSKVDKVVGKTLSTNDYTNDDKSKVAAALTEHQSLENYATKSDLTGKVDKVAGMGLSSNNFSNSDKAKLDQALTEHQSLADYAKTTYVDASINTAIGSIEKLEYVVVETLPETGKGGKIYLLKNESGTYDQYVWIGTEFAKIGGTEIDLSEYLKKNEISDWAKGSSKPSYNYAEIGSKPNTVSGYGITDVKIENGVVVIGDDSIQPLTEHQSLSDYALKSELSGKVDKVTGMGLSANNFSNADKAKLDQALTQHQSLDAYALKSEIPNISNKADKAKTLAGYGITDAKIEEGKITLGEETITPLTSHQDISGKVDKITGKGLSTNDYTTAEKTKLAGVAAGATANAGTVTSVTAGAGLTGGTITSSGSIVLSLAAAGERGGVMPCRSYGESVEVECEAFEKVSGDMITEEAEEGTLLLPVQVDASGVPFVVIGTSVIEKLKAMLEL